MSTTVFDEQIEPVKRLSRDIRAAAATLSSDEARYLVDYYYTMQKDRIRANHQMRTLGEGGEPHAVIAWLAGNTDTLEGQIKSTLDRYTNQHVIGQWAKSVTGIGPIIAAGLMAHIDITKAPTVGHIWSFAGLNPAQKWEKGQKRPWNAELKTLCWKIGESFVKVASLDSDTYGKVYVARKALEQERNLAGALAEQATAVASTRKLGKDTDAYYWYAGCLTVDQAQQIFAAPAEKRMGMAKRIAGAPGSGLPMLPPAHIHSRAKRYAVKLFLSAWHEVAYFTQFGSLPPKPYVIEHLGHAHYTTPPNLDLVPGLVEARAKQGL